MHQLLSNCKVKINNMTDYVFNSSGIEGVYTDDYTFVGTELLKLENKDSLPDEFNINIIFDNINAESFHRDKYYIQEMYGSLTSQLKAILQTIKLLK